MMQPQQDWFERWNLYSPDKIAVREFETNKTLTYSELHRLGNRLAHYLQDNFALKKGDRVAVIAENCLEYVLLFAAALKSGITIVPINYRLAAAEIDYLLENSEPMLVIYDDMFLEALQQAPQFHYIGLRWALEDLAGLCDKQEKHPEDIHFDVVEVDEDHPVFVIYTAGTTGFPKGALYTHKMLFWNSINTAMALILNTESRTVNCMPPYHTGGWNVLLTPFLHHGAYTCQMKKFDPAAVLKLLQEEKATIFMAVPTMLKMIADEPVFEQASFPDLLYIIVGGEPMPIPLIEKWHEKHVPIRQGYGLTEVGPNITSLHHDDVVRKKGSIGRPNFYVQIRVVDEKGNDLPSNKPGELLLQGPMVTPGYWKNEKAMRENIEDGWFHTGDMVRLDEEEYLYVVDRIKNMYKSGGENVYPAEVERVLQQHPSVSEVCVIGVPHEKWGETGKAFIVQNPGYEPNAEELLEFCHGKLSRFKQPKHFEFLKELPKNTAGKINKMELREREIEGID